MIKYILSLLLLTACPNTPDMHEMTDDVSHAKYWAISQIDYTEQLDRIIERKLDGEFLRVYLDFGEMNINPAKIFITIIDPIFGEIKSENFAGLVCSRNSSIDMTEPLIDSLPMLGDKIIFKFKPLNGAKEKFLISELRYFSKLEIPKNHVDKDEGVAPKSVD